MAKNDGGPAFPRTGWTATNQETMWPEDGMSLRDYLAGQAIAGMCANPALASSSVDNWARVAYQISDALIAEREK